MPLAKHKYPWAFAKEPKVEKQPCLSLQEVVDNANFYLIIHSAMLYGLIEGPEVNVERCEHYLDMGKKHGIIPNEKYIPSDFTMDKNYKQNETNT